MKSTRPLGLILAAVVLVASPVCAKVIVDNFDDNVTNTIYWEPFVSYQGGSGEGVAIAETEGLLKITATRIHTLNYFAGYEARFELPGDFDIQVDYYHLNAPPGNQQSYPGTDWYPYWFGTRIGMSFGFSGNNWADIHFVEYWDGMLYQFGTSQGGNGYGNGIYDYGRLRMKRTGTRLEGFAYNFAKQAWDPVGSQENLAFAGNANLNVMVWDGAVGHVWPQDPPDAALLAFSNFRATMAGGDATTPAITNLMLLVD
jgi:hypothetical protein